MAKYRTALIFEFESELPLDKVAEELVNTMIIKGGSGIKFTKFDLMEIEEAEPKKVDLTKI